MIALSESKIVDHPFITLSTLARAMGPTSPQALAQLLEGHKYKRSGPRRSYQAARNQAIALLTDDEPLDPDRLMRPYEREAVQAMQRMKLHRPEWVRAERPSPTHPLWEIEGVSVSMQPDIELFGYLESGAAKFVFTKHPLPRGTGSAMAALLYHYRRNVLEIETTQRSRCIVYEPRLPWIHLPGRKPEHQVRSAALACKVIAALWPSI